MKHAAVHRTAPLLTRLGRTALVRRLEVGSHALPSNLSLALPRLDLATGKQTERRAWPLSGNVQSANKVGRVVWKSALTSS